jgi:putative ABC transport system permease protein
MFKNYFKTAWRNLLRNKTYSSINIFGLAVGLASFIVILLYLNYELSYDKWDNSLTKVYKISARTDEDILNAPPAPLGSFLKQNLPEIEAATTFQPAGDFEYLLSAGDVKIYQNGGITADSSFLKVFPYKIIKGNAATALDKPNAIVISSELSQKLFGNTDPIGKTIKLHNVYENEVTAVMQESDKPSHLKAGFIYRDPYQKQSMFWENFSYLTYVKTTQVMRVEKLESRVDKLYYNERLKKNNQSFEDFRKAGHQAGLFVDAVQDLHNFPKHSSSNFSTVSVLLVLAILLLIAGAINFSNLSIAVSIRRAKEVGVRKVLGSGQRQLLWQFMSEIAFQCLISLCVAVLLVYIALPYFNRQFDINISFLQSGRAGSISAQIALCLLIVILLSGLYPSVFLSYFNTLKVLKGDYSKGKKGIGFRNVLIVAQFTVSAFFIIGTLIISRQMHFMQTKNRGFAGEQVMRIQSTQKTRDSDFEIVRNRLLSIPNVQYVSKTTTVPGDNVTDTSTIPFNHAGTEYRMGSVKVSSDYFTTLNIALVHGRLFNNSYADENTRSAIINETAAKKLHVKNPVGLIIAFPDCDSVPVQIVGVVKDFNVRSFASEVQPVVYTIGNKACRFQSGGAMLVKLAGSHMQQSIASIEQEWKNIEPDFPMRYSFLDENFQKLFVGYIRLQKIISFFATAAILISIMGLFALTAFLTGQRTKEIGIRKVLGAGLSDLAVLLSKDFIRLVAIAVVIALPASWWATSAWLESFAYRINISWWIFAVAALVVLGIAIVTISIQTIKATVANPVKSLRME